MRLFNGNLVPNFLKKYGAVVLSGGSSGIGECLIRLIHYHNPKIIFFNLSRTKPQIFSGECEGEHFPCDLTDLAQLRRAAAQIREALDTRYAEGTLAGGVLLINNSGYGLYSEVAQGDFAASVGMVQLNDIAPVALCLEFLPVLKKRGGDIMNIASLAAFMPSPYLSIYAASKTFLLHFGLGLRAELKNEGINVLSVCPGPTATQFFKRAGFSASPLPRFIGSGVEPVGKAALHALAKGRAVVTPRLTNKLTRVLAALLPRTWAAAIALPILKKIRMDALKKGK